MGPFWIAYYIFMFLWIFGGLALFTWIRFYRIKEIARKTIQIIKDGTTLSLQIGALLAPFLIPIAVSAICLLAG